MIYIKLTGGLGNQMFQYAAARWVQNITGQEICLDYSDYDDYSKNHNATFENTLKNFPIKYAKVIKDKNEFRNDVGPLAKEYYKLYKRLAAVNHILFFEGRIFVERKYQNDWNKRGLFFARDGYIPLFPENLKEKNAVMSGFFQSEKYFPHMREELREEFTVMRSISDANQRWIEKILNAESVCVHIRRGDYAQKGRMHCTLEYYKEAVNLIQKKKPAAEFFVFSDDIKWVKENVDFGEQEINYIEENNDSIDEIRLMYHCKHFVLSNSTFSWWAQYLSANEEKIVVAPRPWFRRIPTDIYSDEWIMLPVYK